MRRQQMPPRAPVERSTRQRRRFAAKSEIMAETVAETVALAEFLVPGVRVPIFDRANLPEKTLALIHGFRARVLDLAYTQPETRELIDQAAQSRRHRLRLPTGDLFAWAERQ
jgi:hypothetical protein